MKLTKLQIQESITKLLSEDNGLNEVLQMTLNGMMYSERSHFYQAKTKRAIKATGIAMPKYYLVDY